MFYYIKLNDKESFINNNTIYNFTNKRFKTLIDLENKRDLIINHYNLGKKELELKNLEYKINFYKICHNIPKYIIVKKINNKFYEISSNIEIITNIDNSNLINEEIDFELYYKNINNYLYNNDKLVNINNVINIYKEDYYKSNIISLKDDYDEKIIPIVKIAKSFGFNIIKKELDVSSILYLGNNNIIYINNKYDNKEIRFIIARQLVYYLYLLKYNKELNNKMTINTYDYNLNETLDKYDLIALELLLPKEKYNLNEEYLSNFYLIPKKLLKYKI